jgi:hypothetical protein
MKWLRRVLLALLLSLLVGLAIGTLLRLRLERPVYYIGAAATPGDGWVAPLLEPSTRPAAWLADATSL